MISIGVVVGGPECSFFRERVSRLSKYCTKERELGSKSGEVNVVFHLPGSVIKPDYCGLRIARFSKKERTLMIQVGVEEEWIASTDDGVVLQYIYETVDEALGMARDELARRGIEYDLTADRQFLDRWKAAEGFDSYLDILSKDDGST